MDRQYTLKSRQIVFERELKSLKSLMYGETMYVWPYMTDAAGEYSEERTIQLVEQLLGGLSGGSLCVDRLSFYKNILYCVLRVMTSGYTEYHMGNVAGFGDPETVTFSRVLSGFASMELLENDTAYFMGALYEIFVRKEADLDCLHTRWEPAEITEEMRKAMEEEAEARIAMEDELSRMQGFDMESIRAEEQKELARSELRKAKEEERLRKTFAHQEHFCKSLDEVRAYLEKTKVEPLRLQADMQEAICCFLWDRGLTVFHDEEAFIAVMVQIKKTIRTAQRFAGEQ